MTANFAHGDNGVSPHPALACVGIGLVMLTWPPAKRGLGLLPRRQVVERDFGWLSQFLRLTRDNDRLPEPVASLHLLAVACLTLQRMLTLAIHMHNRIQSS